MLTSKIRELRRNHKLTQNELANILNVSNGAIAMWETGKREPDYSIINKIAKYFNVSIDYLLGNSENNNSKTVKIPVLGVIPAGVPIEAIEDILDYEEISPEMLKGGKEYFALKIRGDSMSPKYLDGDVVIFLKRDYAEHNDDCAVYVNGYDATFKRVRHNTDGGLILQPLNDKYDPMFYTPEQIENLPIRILGKAVEIRRKV